jgi:hypothetical protein
MDAFRVKVVCHSGYKADEYPKQFFHDNKIFEIEEISDRWYQADRNAGWPVTDYFKVRTTDGGQHILKHEVEEDIWYLIT